MRGLDFFDPLFLFALVIVGCASINGTIEKNADRIVHACGAKQP